MGDRPLIRLRDRPTVAEVAVIVVIGTTVVVATSVAASDGRTGDLEGSVLDWINGWPDALEPAMWLLQLVGVLLAPLLVGVGLAVVGRRWTLVVPFALVPVLKLLLEKAVVKNLVERERPYISWSNEIAVRGSAFDGLSFPSGHTTTAFATAMLVVALVPRRWRPLPVIWAALVGVARMYMGEHNLYDVICGAALGTMIGTILWSAVLALPQIGGPPVRDLAPAGDDSPGAVTAT